MLTSKDVMRLTGISRATLNNYIALGVVPRPSVGPTASPAERARRIGWFPDEVVERIREVQRLKSEGVAMAGIARRFGGEPRATAQAARPAELRSTAPSLSIGDLPHPAYLVDARFELQWCNEPASALLGLAPAGVPTARRDAFAALLGSAALRASPDFRSLLGFHLAAAKARLPREALERAAGGPANRELLQTLFDSVAPLERRQVARLPAAVAADGRPWSLFASFFREGVLFAWTPAEQEEAAALEEMLARRGAVIHEVLRRRPPFLTDLAVLVADLQDADRLKAELPPEAYFELLNELWSHAQPTLRRYYGVLGAHGRDGFVYYFLPQPDGHHALNAALCADELRRAMPELERRWRARRREDLKLRLNFGLDEGREWFGAVQAPGHLEFTALGRAAQRAARLAGWARDGAIVASRRLLADLPPAARERLSWGVRRRDAGGRDWRHEQAFGPAGEGAEALMAAEIFDVAGEKPGA